jgi:hypothetical protein
MDTEHSVFKIYEILKSQEFEIDDSLDDFIALNSRVGEIQFSDHLKNLVEFIFENDEEFLLEKLIRISGVSLDQFFIEFEELDGIDKNEMYQILAKEYGEEGHNIYRLDTKSKKIFFQEATPFSDGIGIYYIEDI